MSSGDFLHGNGQKILKDPELGTKSENISLKLYRHPLMTMYYAFMESFYLIMHFTQYVLSHKKILLALSFISLSLIALTILEGDHQELVWYGIGKVKWYTWWVFLGFLSSCGFGSGLHTFVLYLGPFITRITMAAYECGTTDFPEPPYPNEFLCPEDNTNNMTITMLLIIKKVFLESVLWGVGTAIGELPPYFMARAAALSSKKHGHKLEPEFDESESAWHKRAQEVVKTLVKKVGFFGIMVCASIPNPLFDLAGMTCGHFLVPFSTFFGATVIGKAIIKMTIQMAFVVLLFSKDKVVLLQSLIKKIPRYGISLNSLIDEFLTNQREKIHKAIVVGKRSWLQFILDYVQLTVVLIFVISIIHSLAENYRERLQKWQHDFNRYVQTNHYFHHQRNKHTYNNSNSISETVNNADIKKTH